MENLNKILIISVLLGGLVLNLVSAVDDCWKFWSMSYKENEWFKVVDQNWETNGKYSDFLTIPQQRNIITKADLNVAMLNLKKFCCENELWWLKWDYDVCQEDKSFFNSNALDSQYLFDHIFDIMVRRMNWLTGDNDIYKKTWVDKKWTERREWISEKAEDLEWSDAQSIIDTYKKYRTKSDPRLWYDITKEINWTIMRSDQEFLEYVSWKAGWEKLEESKKVAEAIKNYDNWSLYDRYNNLCAMSAYFYILLNSEGSNNDDKIKVINILSDCEDMMATQISNENKYVQVVMQKSSNLFMKNYIEGYFRYLYDRWNKLKALWKSTTERWLDVVRAVPHLVLTCVKW